MLTKTQYPYVKPEILEAVNGITQYLEESGWKKRELNCPVCRGPLAKFLKQYDSKQQIETYCFKCENCYSEFDKETMTEYYGEVELE